jgi:ATP-dependent Lhr-like helicase
VAEALRRSRGACRRRARRPPRRRHAALFVERGGRSLVPLRDPEDEWLRPALAALVAFVQHGGAKRLAVERFDGEPVTETEVMPLLVEAGFLAGPRRAVLRST